ncbi:uncharacterized protein F4822DRAFT_35253 [Hypoxylon trugodes]|uniref:uncharacterized protein n=1 Tax=Hypoxylon trugodes TaxID=326681 RepID=UPI00219E6112|nr:uncharacterized protein F4822DRAFT_35253 [Hypoxylon trugodes]KAI1394063.1 hypothetical protein F4822DRAFT_35253 [Hypoxylon trugodes]
MYGNYGGLPNAVPPAGSQYNGGAPHSAAHNPHLQPGQVPPNQPSMYNHPHQQFPMGAQAGVGFPGAPNMMPGPGPAGMMQNTGMPHMAATNGPMPNYQPPYTNSPYGAGVPSSVAPQLNVPPNYVMGGGMPMSGYPMHPGMTPQQQQQQHMMQRMQPHQPNASGMSTPTPQRTFQGQPPQSTPTPNNAPTGQQHQMSTPQNAHATPQSQTPNNAQQQAQHQPPSSAIQTPQTPTFPASAQSGPNNASSGPTPLSPGSDSRDKERVGVILEINNELLVEAMQIQNTQQILKKEKAASNGTDGITNEPEKKTTEEEDMLAQDYLHCMRRLQTNLTYLAALADKKGNVTAAPCPTYLKAPPLNTSIRLKMMLGPDGTESQEAPDRGETAKYIQELYKKLQGLYPGIDPNKEPTFPVPPGRQGPQMANAMKSGTRTPGQPSPVPGKPRTPKLMTSAPPSSIANVSTGL